MASRNLCAQMLRCVPRRRRCTATADTTATAAGAVRRCPFNFVQKEVAVVRERRGQLKPYQSIPTPKGLPIVGTIFDILGSGGAAKIHEYCDRRHRELGPIFREKLGAVEAVVLADKDYISSVYSSEGRYPLHLVPEPWVMYNEMKGIKRGLFFMDGSQWLDRRKVLNQSLLVPQEIAKYHHNFSNVVDDVVRRWGRLASAHTNAVVPNLENELYNWSIETLGTIVFGHRLQCVATSDGENSSQQKAQMQQFVNNVQKIFGESAKMSIIPPKLAAKWGLPVWKRFVDAADIALKIARYYTEARIAEIESQGTKDTGLLGRLLQNENVTHDEIVNIVADLILAAADTTSHATQWALYSLAKNPECQEKLLQQVNDVVAPGEHITFKHLTQIPYALWIVKETLRLYPIASFLTRILPNPIQLGGYEIPAGKLMIMSQYTMGRDPKHFEDPNQFRPERWHRDQNGEHQNLSQGCMPFGAGARSCIGKRVAELKMKLLIIKLVQNFKIRSANNVGIALRMITTPDRPIEIQLEKRKQ